MRPYPDNSPQAAARIVAMAMLADDIHGVDGRGHEGESRVLGAAVEHWGLHREMLKAPPSVRCADHG